MRRSSAALAALLSFSLLVPEASAQERFALPGARVAIYNLVGRVTVGPGTGSEVTVEVERAGADARRLNVETGRIDASHTLRVIYPEDVIIYGNENWGGRSEMSVREDGTFGNSWDDHRRDRGRRVRVQARGSGLEAHANLRVMIPAGKEVGIFIGVGSISAANVNGNIRLDASTATITAERMRGSLNLDTGSGDVIARQVEVDNMDVDTGSGEVSLTDITATSLNVDTGSGDVEGSGITSSDLTVDTGSGGITLRGVRAGSLNLDTGSGSVMIQLAGDTRDLVVDTGSGDVTIEVPAGFGSTVDLSTSSGDVDTDLEIQVTRRGRNSLEGRIGDGRGRVQIETGSGDIQLRASR